MQRIATENTTGNQLVTLTTNMVMAKHDQIHNEMLLNPADYVGKAILMQGVVHRSLNAGGSTVFIVNRNGSGGEPVAVAYNASYLADKGDPVSVLGYCAGLQNVEGVEMPAVAARIVDTPERIAKLYIEVGKLVDENLKSKK